jgi:hypothetical protein
VVKGLDITTGQFVAVKRLPREAVDEKKMMVCSGACCCVLVTSQLIN